MSLIPYHVSVFLVVHKIWWIWFFVRPHTFSLTRDCVHRNIVFWLRRGSLVFIYTWHQIFFLRISENIQGFCWVYNFSFQPLITPYHDDPLGLRIVQLLCISRVVIRITNHNGLVCIIRIFSLIFPLLVTYEIRPNYENEPTILSSISFYRKFQTGSLYWP